MRSRFKWPSGQAARIKPLDHALKEYARRRYNISASNWHRGKVGPRCLRFHRHEEFRLGLVVGHFKRKLASVALVALLSLAPRPGTAGGGVFVPGFWDPHRRAPKPDLTGLRSLRFLTEDDYPPFHFALPDGSLSGFDVDLARAICDEFKITCTVQARRFDTLIDALNDHQCDALMAAIRIDAQTRAKLDFSGRYYTTPARFASLKAVGAEPAMPESLREKTVGVQARSAHDAYLERFFPGTIRKSYESQKLLREALVTGEIDTIFGDGISLSLWLDSHVGLHV